MTNSTILQAASEAVQSQLSDQSQARSDSFPDSSESLNSTDPGKHDNSYSGISAPYATTPLKETFRRSRVRPLLTLIDTSFFVPTFVNLLSTKHEKCANVRGKTEYNNNNYNISFDILPNKEKYRIHR